MEVGSTGGSVKTVCLGLSVQGENKDPEGQGCSTRLAHAEMLERQRGNSLERLREEVVKCF